MRGFKLDINAINTREVTIIPCSLGRKELCHPEDINASIFFTPEERKKRNLVTMKYAMMILFLALCVMALLESVEGHRKSNKKSNSNSNSSSNKKKSKSKKYKSSGKGSVIKIGVEVDILKNLKFHFLGDISKWSTFFTSSLPWRQAGEPGSLRAGWRKKCFRDHLWDIRFLCFILY